MCDVKFYQGDKLEFINGQKLEISNGASEKKSVKRQQTVIK